MPIQFEKANFKHQPIILDWLQKPHIVEFWDNSQEHKDDILTFMQGRIKPSPYAEGIFTYWVGSLDNEPYCFVMTSEVLKNEPALLLWQQHLSETGKTFTLDFCIGNEKFLGKGLAASTLEAFTQFYSTEVDQESDTFFIDPLEDNPRAKHVYGKAGFKIVGEFICHGPFFKGKNSYLMVKQVSNKDVT